ncbi:MAG: hypothetical protein ACFLMY_05115 [Candidatus Brachytrichaceae bacterium NZ_4S206]|jgi:hypothetical protein
MMCINAARSSSTLMTEKVIFKAIETWNCIKSMKFLAGLSTFDRIQGYAAR